jgi:hypothetical protein
MAKGRYGSSISIHEGSSGTCILIASGSNPQEVAADIRDFVARTDGYRYSDIAPKIKVRLTDERVIADGEGGKLEDVAAALIAQLTVLPCEPPDSLRSSE